MNEKSDQDSRHIPFPKAGICLLTSKVFERSAFHGVRTVLVMYLTIYLTYSPDQSTLIFHTFNILTFTMSILGAIISDSWLGKYRTILYMSSVYAIGLICISLGSVSPLNLPGREFTILALILIAIGSGSLKPCMSAFSGDQFQLPQQEKQMSRYFAMYTMTLKVAYLYGSSLAPIMRHDVQCFGNSHCFPLALGVPVVFGVCALAVFLVGNLWYRKLSATSNILYQVCKCATHAAIKRFRNRKTHPKPHWLDHAEEQYGRRLVTDVKILFNMIPLLLTFPMYFALNEQIGSRWTFQAASMNGDLGFYHVKPDQMQMVIPVLVLIFLSVWDWWLLPIAQRYGMRYQMKFVIGGALAAISFLAAGGLQLAIGPTAAVLPRPGECQVRIFNGQSCEFDVMIGNVRFGMESARVYQRSIVLSELSESYNVQMVAKTADCEDVKFAMHLTAETAMSYYVDGRGHVIEYEDNVSKRISGEATLRILHSNVSNDSIQIRNTNNDLITEIQSAEDVLPIYLSAGDYQVYSCNQTQPQAEVQLGFAGVYTLLLNADGSGHLHVISPPNTITILWILPQYVLMALAESMFAMTGMFFAYREGPQSMKAVSQSMWLMTMSAGNLIDVIIIGANFFGSQAYEFFLFSGLMVVDGVVMFWLAKHFKSFKTD